jgi:hypothetical protein
MKINQGEDCTLWWDKEEEYEYKSAFIDYYGPDYSKYYVIVDSEFKILPINKVKYLDLREDDLWYLWTNEVYEGKKVIEIPFKFVDEFTESEKLMTKIITKEFTRLFEGGIKMRNYLKQEDVILYDGYYFVPINTKLLLDLCTDIDYKDILQSDEIDCFATKVIKFKSDDPDIIEKIMELNEDNKMIVVYEVSSI